MNSKLREQLIDLLSDQLNDRHNEAQDSGRPYTWTEVASDVMDFIYGEEPQTPPQAGKADIPGQVEGVPGGSVSACCGNGGSCTGAPVADPAVDRPSLTGEVRPPTNPQLSGFVELFRDRFVYLGGPQSLTAEYVPVPRSTAWKKDS